MKIFKTKEGKGIFLHAKGILSDFFSVELEVCFFVLSIYDVIMR